MDEMVKLILRMGVKNDQVLAAIRNTDRKEFVPEAFGNSAYEDRAIPIGHGQTMSQPYTVARMCELLTEGKDGPEKRKVLEIGTGSGWQTAILARLFAEIYTIEIISKLSVCAREVICDLGFVIENIHFKTGDGKKGWEEYAPYDGIICGADAREIPEAWKRQLAEGGRIVCPVKGEMSRITKNPSSRTEQFRTEKFGKYVFVPLV